MPSRELSTSAMSGPTVGPDWVAARVREPADSCALLLLDCRPPDQFGRCRVRGALGVSLPASLIVLRRLSNGKLCVSSVLRDARQREAFEACYRRLPVVLYDADGSYADAHVTGVLVQRLRQDGCQVYCLQGEDTVCQAPRSCARAHAGAASVARSINESGGLGPSVLAACKQCVGCSAFPRLAHLLLACAPSALVRVCAQSLAHRDRKTEWCANETCQRLCSSTRGAAHCAAH